MLPLLLHRMFSLSIEIFKPSLTNENPPRRVVDLHLVVLSHPIILFAITKRHLSLPNKSTTITNRAVLFEHETSRVDLNPIQVAIRFHNNTKLDAAAFSREVEYQLLALKRDFTDFLGRRKDIGRSMN